MAEAIVGPLVSKLQELALSEGKALVAVSGDIRRLRDKLMWLLAFLQEAEPSLGARGGELMRVFVHQIRDAAFSAEDAIDEYYVRVDLSRYPGWSRPALGFLAGVTTQLRVRHNLSGKIAAINARLEGIVSNKSTYCPVDPFSVLPVKTWTASAASLSESILWLVLFWRKPWLPPELPAGEYPPSFVSQFQYLTVPSDSTTLMLRSYRTQSWSYKFSGSIAFMLQ